MMQHGCCCSNRTANTQRGAELPSRCSLKHVCCDLLCFLSCFVCSFRCFVLLYQQSKTEIFSICQQSNQQVLILFNAVVYLTMNKTLIAPDLTKIKADEVKAANCDKLKHLENNHYWKNSNILIRLILQKTLTISIQGYEMRSLGQRHCFANHK